jgi:hypothetical protein
LRDSDLFGIATAFNCKVSSFNSSAYPLQHYGMFGDAFRILFDFLIKYFLIFFYNFNLLKSKIKKKIYKKIVLIFMYDAV